MTLSAPALIVGSYLVGSIPVAYLMARARRHVDIRLVGSGNVGGSNMRAVEGWWATVVVGVLDIAKGALPVWLGLRSGLGEPVAFLAAVAVVVGHDWSVWLRFQGGRGGASTLGVLLVAFPLGMLWVLALLAIGALVKWVAPLHAFAVLSVPGVAAVAGRPSDLVVLLVVMAALMVVKRLEANRRFRTGGSPDLSRGMVMRNRLILDRDRP